MTGPGADAPPLFAVFYSCKQCGLQKQRLLVPERSDSEDAGQWVDRISPLISADHRQRCRSCPSQHCDLIIPYPAGTPALGKNQRH